MKKAILLITILLCLSTAKAQKIGGFGYISVGASYITSTQIQNRLQEDALFGGGFSFNQPGTHIGARVMGVFDRFLVGGAGYNSSFTGNSDSREVNLKVIGRFLNVGYFLVKKPRIQAYSFIGIGSGNSRLILPLSGGGGSTNGVRSFGADQDIIGISPEVFQKSIGYEFGVGIQRFISLSNSYDEVQSGFLVGLVAGMNLLPSTKWEFKANETNVANMGNMSSFYIGITLGGGGFSN